MNDLNKLKLPDDWAEGYESPITLALQEIADKITEGRDDLDPDQDAGTHGRRKA